ncbi:MAG: hypothetical protein Q9217_001081 [Psora testacea]
MSGARKYAGLPDLDHAPDIYETPDLTDDTSTHPTSTAFRSESTDSSCHDPFDEDVNGIDRHRINQDEARIHFIPSGERGITPSSRISGKRKSYKDSNIRRGKDGQGILNGLEISSGEDEESLERKLARLRREVAEVKGEFEKQKSEVERAEDVRAQEEALDIDSLSLVLNGLDRPTAKGGKSAARRLMQNLRFPSPSTKPVVNGASHDPTKSQGDDSSFTVMYGPTTQVDHNIPKIADFDARLSLLEAILGIDAIPLPTQDRPPSKALLPTLDVLDKQITTLSSSTETSIDNIRGRVKELAQEAESLERRRNQAKRTLENLPPANIRPSAPTNSEVKDADLADDEAQDSKINAIYGTLNTIESLAPLLPSVLDRLRSLRLLHADAAAASQSLANLEGRQADMKQELQDWREGLERVEKAMQQGEEAMKANTEVVEGWVKELEERTKKLT